MSYFDEAEDEHRKTVEAERERKENVRKYQEQLEKEKQEEKERRRAAREAARKANELRKLKEEVNEQFILKGEPREHILLQDLVEVNGNYQKTPVVGGLGGLLGQMIICFSAIHKKWKKEQQDFLNPKVIQNFLYLYIDAKMRSEKLILQVGKCIEDFLNSLEKPLQLNEMRVMKEANYLKFRQLLSDPSQFGDEILGLMKSQAKSLTLSAKAFDLVYEGLWDIYCKKS